MAKKKEKSMNVDSGKSCDDKFWDKGVAKNKQEFPGSAASGKSLPASDSGDLSVKQEFGGK
jgi:hypothetical protein